MKSTQNLDYDICQCDWLVAKIRGNKSYAQNLYAAMCNQAWQYQDVWILLTDRVWSCSWRSAGAIVADIRGEGDYLDWYCSGMMKSHPDDDLGGADTVKGYVSEGTITNEVLCDLAQIGWQPVVD